MAEKGSPTGEAASNSPTMAEIASGLMLGQSKSTSEQFLGFSELEQPGDGKNKMVLVCQQCRSRVLKPGYGTLVDKEVYSSTGLFIYHSPWIHCTRLMPQCRVGVGFPDGRGFPDMSFCIKEENS